MHVSFLLQLLLVLLKDSLAHQWRAGHWLCSGGQYPALTREDPSLDTDCATAMAPPLWTLQERGADSMCWLDWLHSPATLCKWQQSMLEGLDHTVQLSLWRHCRIVSILHNNSWCQVNICLYTASVDSALVDAFNCTAVRVSWTPLNIPMVDHYTVHYTNIACGNSLSETFPVSASSGVVSGLQEGQQYQFSVTVSFTVSGQVFKSIIGSMQAITGDYVCMYVCWRMGIILSNTSYIHVLITSVPRDCSSLFPSPSQSACRCSGDQQVVSAGWLGVISVVLIVSLIGNIVTGIGCVWLWKKRKSKLIVKRCV